MGFNDLLTAKAQDRAMARAVALSHPVRAVSFEALRLVVVYGCSLALIAAGFLR